jgi:hypothetical protein
MAVMWVTEVWHREKDHCRNIAIRDPYAPVPEHFTILATKYITQLMPDVYIQLQDKRFASMRRNRENRFETAQQAELVNNQLNKYRPATAQLQVPSHRQSAR